MIFIIILVIVMVVGGIAFATYRQIKATDPNNMKKKEIEQSTITQNALPFEDIKDNCISLGMHQYRAVIKCSSINYALKTDKEQDIIEMSYQRFLNSLQHPISIAIQTKAMDNTKMLKGLSEDISEVIKENPIMNEYGQIYLRDMENVCQQIGNNKEKNKYIIIPFNDAVVLTNSTEEEKYDYSIKELQSRCEIIIEALRNIGIIANRLDTNELIELLYSNYHKEETSQAEHIVNNEYTTLTVKGEDRLSQITEDGLLDWILYEAQLRLETEINSNKISKIDVKHKTIKAIEELNKIRNDIAGYYKTSTTIKKIKVDEEEEV